MNHDMKRIVAEAEDEVRRKRNKAADPEDLRWSRYIFECAEQDGWQSVRRVLLASAAESLLLIEEGDLRAATEAKDTAGASQGESQGG